MRANVAEISVPCTYEEAVTGPHAAQWTQAIREELAAHDENGTWSYVPRNPAKAPIKSKWVFKVIDNTHDNSPKFKARLCAKGFQQQQGIDYTETFAPVVRYDSLRVLLALTAQEDLEMITFDVRTAFLYGNLQEEIDMEIPIGAEVNSIARRNVEKKTRMKANVCENAKYVCRLNKSLYGLKQAPRCWNHRFKEFLSKLGFVESDAGKCIFVSTVMNEHVFLALYVDDGLIACKSKTVIKTIVESLRKEFKITIGDGSFFVGMEIYRDRSTKSLFINQGAYARRTIDKYGMSDANPVSVPADPNNILRPVENDDDCLDNVPYRELVGSLTYQAIISRPDIAFATSNVNKILKFKEVSVLGYQETPNKFLERNPMTRSWRVVSLLAGCRAFVDAGQCYDFLESKEAAESRVDRERAARLYIGGIPL
ncbi:unnamed protein product, partial [Trichogramma brassicae]